ncbi:MAG TPA: hypothetical protein VJP40_05620 [bacterium]|nr:hypothetical protein [bacterium]
MALGFDATLLGASNRLAASRLHWAIWGPLLKELQAANSRLKAELGLGAGEGFLAWRLASFRQFE